MTMSERDLERLAPRLGEDAGKRLDIDRVAQRVTARLRTAGGPTVSVPVGQWLAVAAGVLLMVGAALFTFAADGTPPRTRVAVAALTPGLQDLSVAELDEVLDSLNATSPARLDGRSTLDDLDAEQLQRLLALMEG